MNMKTALVLAALACVSAGPRNMSETAKRLEGSLDKDLFEFFEDEIQDSYPNHVKAYAIVEVQILGVRELTYCPLRTAGCGDNPTCDHPKKTRTVHDIDIIKKLFTTAPVAMPKNLAGYTFFQPTNLKQNDTAYVSLYVYDHQVTANGNVNISRIRKIEAPKPVDDKSGKDKPKFTPRNRP